MENILGAIISIVAILLLIKLLFWKICINTAAGCVLLALSNLFAPLTGLYIDITFLHGCLVGFLGLPGYVLAVLHQLFF